MAALRPDPAEPTSRGWRHGRAREIRERLRVAGLLAPRGWAARREGLLGGVHSPATRLRAVLDDLGPLYAAFAGYLSLRCDLLPRADTDALAQPSRRPHPFPQEQAERIIRLELGRRGGELASLGGAAHWSPLFQWHSARLPDGAEVRLKLVRPDLEAQWAREADLLQTLGPARVGTLDGGLLDMPAALDDFPEFLQHRLDLRATANGLVELSQGGGAPDGLVAAEVLRPWCSRQLLAVRVLPDSRPLEPGDSDVARRVSLSWLQQALLAPVCPEHLEAGELLQLADGRIGICGGTFGRIDPELRVDLLRFLVAAATSRPDRVCALLPAISTRSRGALSYRKLYHQLRQAEPFRTGGWSDSHPGERCADTVLIYSRLARQAGHPLLPQAATFARALLCLERHAEALAPSRDGLRQGLDDLRVIAAAVRLREQLGPGAFPETVYRLVETGTAVLERVADSARPAAHQAQEPREPKHDMPASALAAGLLMASLVLLVHAALGALDLAPPGEALAAGTYLGAGLVGVWILSRRGAHERRR